MPPFPFKKGWWHEEVTMGRGTSFDKLAVDIATGDVEDNDPKSNGSRVGIARASVRTAEQRKGIATRAAYARWKSENPSE